MQEVLSTPFLELETLRVSEGWKSMTMISVAATSELVCLSFVGTVRKIIVPKPHKPIVTDNELVLRAKNYFSCHSQLFKRQNCREVAPVSKWIFGWFVPQLRCCKLVPAKVGESRAEMQFRLKKRLTLCHFRFASLKSRSTTAGVSWFPINLFWQLRIVSSGLSQFWLN